MMWTRESESPKPPDLVTTRTPWAVPPTIVPMGTPGASADVDRDSGGADPVESRGSPVATDEDQGVVGDP